MNVETSPEFLTGEEVLRLLRNSTKFPRQTLQRLRRDGLPSAKILGRYLYPKAEVIAFLKGLSE